MKVYWLNENRSEAIVSRGWWLWRREAHVVRAPGTSWKFPLSGTPVPEGVRDKLQHAEYRAIADDKRRAQQQDWVRPVQIPRARLIEPGRRPL